MIYQKLLSEHQKFLKSQFLIKQVKKLQKEVEALLELQIDFIKE